MFALLLAAVLTTTTPAKAQGTDLNFSDPLDGSASPSHLTVPAGKYSYGLKGLTRTQSTDGTAFGDGDSNADRPMVKTVSGAFMKGDFTFCVDVTAPSTNSDLIYVGFGQGTANPNYFNEPTESYEFRIHNNAYGYYGIQAAVDVGQIPMGFAFDQQIGTLQPDATTTFCIARSGADITFSVPNQKGATVTVPSNMVPSLDNSNAYLFFGNTAVGTRFSNLSVVFKSSDTEPPVISGLTATPSLIWPPNHKMMPVTLQAVATDNVGVTSLKIKSVDVVEAEDSDADAKGKESHDRDHGHDGDSHGVGNNARSKDFEITGDLALKLRAERGNKYTITVEAQDAAGNATTKSVTVSVPKNYSLNRFPFSR